MKSRKNESKKKRAGKVRRKGKIASEKKYINAGHATQKTERENIFLKRNICRELSERKMPLRVHITHFTEIVRRGRESLIVSIKKINLNFY